MRIKPRPAAVLLGLFVLWIQAAVAQAPAFEYTVLIDADGDGATGCSYDPPGGGPIRFGFEQRLNATVDAGTLQVTALDRQACSGGLFDVPVAVDGVGAPPWPVALNDGVGGADAVEFGALRQELDLDGAGRLRLAFAADNDAGSDVLASVDGSDDAEPIVFGQPAGAAAIPVLSVGGLALLVGAVALAGWLARGRAGRSGLASLVALASVAAVAGSWSLDGQLGDWSGESPIATDPAGDASDGSQPIDLVAAFAVDAGAGLFFRIDVVEVGNRPPLASDDAYAATADTALNVPAPGVLANDDDPEGDLLSAQLVDGPSNAAGFALNADGGFEYTPQAGFTGSDSFTYRASDGSLLSGPATVTITVSAAR
jgi:hypothetical protein